MTGRVNGETWREARGEDAGSGVQMLIVRRKKKKGERLIIA